MPPPADRHPIESAPNPARRVSVVIATLDSQAHIDAMIDDVLAYFDDQGLDGEVILVNDGSTDGTWSTIEERAATDRRIVAIDLDGNHGQHTAQFVGLAASRGEFIITMDDDGQHPLTEIGRLLDRAADDHDLVVGRFRRKRHPIHRRIGSWLVGHLIRLVFSTPKGFTVSSFRCMRRDLVDRMVATKHPFPYISGLAIVYSKDRINVDVEHHARRSGRSTYRIHTLAALTARIVMYARPALRGASIVILATLVAASSLFAFRLLVTLTTAESHFILVLAGALVAVIATVALVAAFTVVAGAEIAYRLHRGAAPYRVVKVAGNGASLPFGNRNAQ